MFSIRIMQEIYRYLEYDVGEERRLFVAGIHIGERQ